MNSKVKGALLFLAGAGLGGGTAWFFTKKKYEAIIEEKVNSEIQSVRETYNKLQKELAEKNEKMKEELIKISSTTEKVFTNGDKVETISVREEDDDEKAKEEKFIRERMPYGTKSMTSINNEAATKPYVIDPNEYGSNDDYNIYCYTYYNNGILADEGDEKLEEDEIAARIGDALEHFGEEDAVYVRNDVRRCDYEIIKSLDNYIE